jgi:hypothetical protein
MNVVKENAALVGLQVSDSPAFNSANLRAAISAWFCATCRPNWDANQVMLSIGSVMRGLPCGICSPHMEHFAETGMLFSSYLICSSGRSGIIPHRSNTPFVQAAAISLALGLFAKQVLHMTGLPSVGLNGTVAFLPHSEQMMFVSI